MSKQHYTQVKVSVNPDIATAFKEKCVASGVSMASELSRFMGNSKTKPGIKTATRQQRRKAVKLLIEQLEAVIMSERSYGDNIPENLQNSQVYETAQQTLQILEEASQVAKRGILAIWYHNFKVGSIDCS